MNRKARKKPKAEIVRSGSWLADGRETVEVWIVKQNFACGGDALNAKGEVYYVCHAHERALPVGHIYGGPSLQKAQALATRATPGRITWDNQRRGQPLTSGLFHPEERPASRSPALPPPRPRRACA